MVSSMALAPPRGLIALKFLIGDFITCLLSWQRLRRQELIAVVPANGAFSYLADLCRMSPVVAETILIPVPDILDERCLRKIYFDAAQKLVSRGISSLAMFDYEHFPFGDRKAFFKPYFDDIDLDGGRMIDGVERVLYIPFTVPDPERVWAQSLLEQHGITRYITVHNREGGWATRLESAGSACSGADINNMRNHSIHPILDACRDALPSDWRIVRLGDPSMAPQSERKLLDATSLGLTLTQQAALLARCEFFIGGGSGMLQLASALARPTITINMAHRLGYQANLNATCIGLEKKVYVAGKPTRFSEIPMVTGGETTSRLKSGLGYDIRENTSAEIAGAIHVMLVEQTSCKSLMIDDAGHAVSLEQYLCEFVGGPPLAFCHNHVRFLVQFEKALEPNPHLSYACMDRWDSHRPYRVGLFGAGSFGRTVLRPLQRQTAWTFLFFDNDSTKVGTCIDGIEVYSPQTLANHRLDFIVVTSSTDGGRVPTDLANQGLVPGRDLITCAEASDPALYNVERLLWERFDLSAPRRLALIGNDSIRERVRRRLAWRTTWELVRVDGASQNLDGDFLADTFILFCDTQTYDAWRLWLKSRELKHGIDFLCVDDAPLTPYKTNFLNPRAAQWARQKRWVDAG